MTKRLFYFWRSCAALVLGALCALAFAPYSIFPFAIFAPAGLLALWLQPSPKLAAWEGFLFGLGLFAVGVYWIYISVHFFGDIAPLIAIGITVGFIAILACFIALTGYLTVRYFPTQTLRIFWGFPAIWVTIEWMRSWFMTGFPWLLLGYSQINTPLKGYAPLVSVYGVSLAVLLTSACLTHGILHLQKRNYLHVYINLFAIVVLWTIGSLLHLIPWTTATTKKLDVALVQGNVPQSIKWSPNHLQLSLDRYQDLSAPLWGKDKLIIWPEAAIPVALQDAEDFINQLDDKALATHSTLITGIPIMTDDGQGYLNAVISLGENKNVYAKRHLVPFGEYVPLIQLARPILNWLNIPLFMTVPGPMSPAPFVINGIKIDPSICYEIAFPELIYTDDANTGLLLTVTNDAWFGKSSAQAQHLQMAQMRALELKRPLLFVSNDGITAMVTADGGIDTAIAPYEAGILHTKITAYYGKTPWMRYGINSILMLLLLMLGSAALQEKKIKQTRI